MAERLDIFSVIHRISFINAWLDDELGRRLKGMGNGKITTNYSPTFKVLELAGGVLPITQLAERMHQSKPYMTHVVKQLIDSGYLRREKSEDDKRINYVILTEKGRALSKEIDDAVQTTTEECLNILTHEEMKILTILLDKLSVAASSIVGHEHGN